MRSLSRSYVLAVLVIFAFFLSPSLQKKDAKTGKKKDIRDYTDAEIEALYDQWEEDEEELPEDEKPEHLKKPKPIDMTKMDMSNPDSIMKMSKSGKPTMMFVSVSGNPTEKESSDITALWQSSLFNANMEVQRYMIESNRAIFMVKDGANSFEVKDFLVKQERCAEVTIDQQTWKGKGAGAQDGKKTKKTEL